MKNPKLLETDYARLVLAGLNLKRGHLFSARTRNYTQQIPADIYQMSVPEDVVAQRRSRSRLARAARKAQQRRT